MTRPARPSPAVRAAASSAAWRVSAASVRGTSHAAGGTPCQDAHAWAAAGGLLIAAVADGAGTAPLAEHGAAAAVRAAVASLRDALGVSSASESTTDVDRTLPFSIESTVSAETAAGRIPAAFAAALVAVRTEADGRGADARDLATTLAVAVAGPGWAAAAQVGDGAVVVRDGGGALRTLGAADGGEYLNETVFLTSPGALDGLRAAVWEGAPTHLALLTDGLQMLALRMPGRAPHLPFFDPLFRFAEAQDDAAAGGERLAAFLAGPRVAARADDDLTLLLAVLHPTESEAR